MKSSSKRVSSAAGPLAEGAAGTDPARDEDLKLGARVRSFRAQSGATLAEMAARTSISIGQLSEIERGISTPSLRSLRLISRALDMPVSRFFENADDELEAENRFVLRRAARPILRLTPTGVIKTLLSPNCTGQLSLYEITLRPGGSSGGEFQTGSGEKAGFVTSGRLRLFLDNRPMDLDEGDSFQFPADMPHSLENPFDTPTTMLWVVSSDTLTTPFGLPGQASPTVVAPHPAGSRSRLRKA